MNEIEKVLLVEDDKVEVLKFKRVLKQLDIKSNFSISKNGEEALNYLKEELPDLILLDLNMPRMNGFEFLEAIKNTRYEKIPLFILTTSNSDQDIEKSKEYKIKGYVVKPIRYEDYKSEIKQIFNNALLI
ncbi:MAG: response regulator [Flavobacteriales bacterium]